MFNYTKLDESKVEYIEIAQADEIANGERMFLEIDGRPIVVFRIADDYYAIADVCSHDDGPVGEGDLVGYDITCPRHGARFDVRNGKVLSLPAYQDIPAYPVRLVDGKLELGLPLE